MAEKMTDKEKRFQTAHIRQELVKALKVDLIGPMEADEVIDEDPRFEYLTGMLYAQSLAERAEFCDQEVDMDADITSKQMSRMIATNVNDERNPAVRRWLSAWEEASITT